MIAGYQTVSHYVVIESGQACEVAIQVGMDAQGAWRVREWPDSPGPNEPWPEYYASRDAAEEVARQYAEDRDEGLGLSAEHYQVWLDSRT